MLYTLVVMYPCNLKPFCSRESSQHCKQTELRWTCNSSFVFEFRDQHVPNRNASLSAIEWSESLIKPGR